MVSMSGNSVYPHDVLTVLFCLLTASQAYVNVALNKAAYQQYSWFDTSFRFDMWTGDTGDDTYDTGDDTYDTGDDTYDTYDAFTFDASNAVDGRKSDLSWNGSQCANSLPGETATWWVNLITIHSIHHITIYFMTDNQPWGPSNSIIANSLGFSVYVSNTTDRLQGTLCYKDDNFTLDTIPAVFTTTCPVHGQYVIYYNERLRGVTYPRDYSYFVQIGLCEVEVYACDRGSYGYSCKETCGHCRDLSQCSNINGWCLTGCDPGYQGDLCKTSCDRGSYGSECKETCGHCRDVNQCSINNGTCLTGCDAGFKGDLCKTTCDRGSYGYSCKETCGHCRDVSQCSNINGWCLTGCDPGYQGDLCKTSCDKGSYGSECNETCGHCRDGNQCSINNGTCLTGCDAGFKGDLCKTNRSKTRLDYVSLKSHYGRLDGLKPFDT